jgi:CDP-6-deoxy-D-xylo-4-hexulose-3-dehydrase
MTDLQASIGLAQVAKIETFGAARRANHRYLREALAEFGDFLEFQEPTPGSDPSWFGFLMVVREGAPFSRDDLVAHVEKGRIQTRMLFAGNLVRHPCFDEMRARGEGYRIVGDLAETDRIMERAFWVGVYPGMTRPQLEFMADWITSFCRNPMKPALKVRRKAMT